MQLLTLLYSSLNGFTHSTVQRRHRMHSLINHILFTYYHDSVTSREHLNHNEDKFAMRATLAVCNYNRPYVSQIAPLALGCIVETDKVNHVVETYMVKLVVEIESFGMSADELDKETGSSDGLQPQQADLSCVHALNEPHLHEIYVVPSRHEADQC
ncbi:hypothetical protein Tco_0893212 [Tanacetum coccineum]|uniref:Uncharacterized protein n=1 Tax=Tanacetum coccineum TaxID=301880 RepID=A0ABQ5C862_9ASTR